MNYSSSTTAGKMSCDFTWTLSLTIHAIVNGSYCDPFHVSKGTPTTYKLLRQNKNKRPMGLALSWQGKKPEFEMSLFDISSLQITSTWISRHTITRAEAKALLALGLPVPSTQYMDMHDDYRYIAIVAFSITLYLQNPDAMIKHDCPLKPWTCWMDDGGIWLRVRTSPKDCRELGFHLKMFEKLN
jgi:hypothetical protein